MNKKFKRFFFNYKNISLKKLQEQLCHNIRKKFMQIKYPKSQSNNMQLQRDLGLCLKMMTMPTRLTTNGNEQLNIITLALASDQSQGMTRETT